MDKIESTTERKIAELGDKVIADYANFRKEQISRSSVINSIGFLISSMRKYELEGGHYGERSICVLPNCSPIVDLSLIYWTDNGLARYILTIRPNKGTRYTIFSNRLYYIDHDDREDLFAQPTFVPTYEMRKEGNRPLKPPLRSEQSDSKTRSKATKSESKTSKTSSSVLPTEFCCLYRYNNCCYTKKNHPTDCKQCCIGKEHHHPF